MSESNISWDDIRALSAATTTATREGKQLPRCSLYSVLESWCKFLYNYRSARAKNSENVLSLGTADNYLSQMKQLLCENFGGLDEGRCRKIRGDMKKIFTERSLKMQILQKQAPAIIPSDYNILGDLLFRRGDEESLELYAMFVIQWHMLGRSIDCCWLQRSQLTVVGGGELFVRFTRLKTSSLQGVSMYPHKQHWHLCPLFALAVALITPTAPSALVFRMFEVQDIAPEVEDNITRGVGAVSQLEASLLGVVDEHPQVDDDPPSAQQHPQSPATKKQRVRKRPSAAQFLNTKLRSLVEEYRGTATHALGEAPLTSALQSHSVRRGAAQWANACHKIAVQWLCTRGMWAMDSLSKAFAYIGTTLQEDQKIAKRLSFCDPDDTVLMPDLAYLRETLPQEQSTALQRCQASLFRHCRDFQGPSEKCNIDSNLTNLLFATLLVHFEGIRSLYPGCMLVQRVAAACQESACDEETLAVAGKLVRERFHAQSIAADHECAKCSIKSELVRLHEQMLRLHHKLDVSLPARPPISANCDSEPTLGNMPLPKENCLGSSTSISTFVYQWYTTRPWENVPRTKQGQSHLSDMCFRIAALKIVACGAFQIDDEPPKTEVELHGRWCSSIFDISRDWAGKFNANLGAIDGKKPTQKASTIRRRFQTCPKTSAFIEMCRSTRDLIASSALNDLVTPEQHRKEEEILRKLLEHM